MLVWIQALGKHIGELIGCRHSVERKMPELCHFMRKVLPDVDVLSSFLAANHIVGPLDTRSVNLITRIGDLGPNPTSLSN